MQEQYVKFIEEIVANGHAEEVPSLLEGLLVSPIIWGIPPAKA